MVREFAIVAAFAVIAAGCASAPADNTAELLKRSAAGDASACEQLGERAMFYGVGGRIDYPAALADFERAAAKSDPRAVGFKALLLRDYPLPDGNDPDAAAKLFDSVRVRLAAMKDDPAANYLLAVFDGPASPDWQARLEFAENNFYYPATVQLARHDASDRSRQRRLRRAADHGSVEAMYLLGDRANLSGAARMGYPAALPLEESADRGCAVARLQLASNPSLPFDRRKELYALALTAGIGGDEFEKFLLDQGDRGHAALLAPESVPELHYYIQALGPLTVRDRAFPSDYQRSAWYDTTDPEALKTFFEANRDHSNEPAYWLAYALAAARAGQGECAVYGARRYRAAGGDAEAAQLIEDHGRAMVSGGTVGELPANSHLLEMARAFFGTVETPQPFYDVVLGRIITDEDQLNSTASPVEPPLQPVAVEP
ncbi:MAG: hypothetical protein AB7F40_09495 [Victivallaceae bacterium]|nr:hypothetical protein [Victivallaceae bacterium]